MSAALAFVALLAAAPFAAAAAAEGGGGFDPFGEVGFEQRLGERLPLDARLHDREGHEVRLGDVLAERPTLLVLVYYRCPMLCNQVLDGVVRALRPLSFDAGKEFQVVAISIDPADTPERANAKHGEIVEAYGRAGSADGWRFLVADQATIDAVCDAAGYHYALDPETGEYAHAAGVVAVTPEGVLARYFYGIDYPTKELRLALVEASEGRIGTLADQVLLLCYHYDPTTGRYGFAILGALRAAGVLTVVVLGVAVTRMLRRERRPGARHGPREGGA